MKTKIENLSFIVLISFQFGIGTDKTYSSEAISDLKSFIQVQNSLQKMKKNTE